MEILDLSQSSLKQTIQAGTILCVQGDKAAGFNVLHKGVVELLYTPKGIQNQSKEEILTKSYRVSLIKGEITLGVCSLLGDGIQNVSMRALTECSVSITPMTKEELLGKMHKSSSLITKILRDFVLWLDSNMYVYKSCRALWERIAIIADSIALGIPLTGQLREDNIPQRQQAELSEYGPFLKKTAKGLPGGEKLKDWDSNIFLGAIHKQMDLYGERPSRLEEMIDHPQYLFIKRILGKNDKLLAHFFHQDEPLGRYIFVFFNKAFDQFFEAINDLIQETQQLIDNLYKEEGWVMQAIEAGDHKDPQVANFLYFVGSFSWRVKKDINNLLGMDLGERYPSLTKLKKFNTMVEVQDSGKRSQPNDPEAKRILAKYDDLLEQILEFANKGEDFNENFRKHLDQLHGMDSYYGTEPGDIKIREMAAKLYWQLYESCFLKVVEGDLKSFVPGIMLHMGVVDKRFLDNEDLLLIDRLYNNISLVNKPVPIMTLPYFLKKIYMEEVKPSMTDMGDLFETVLRNQEKLTKREREETYIYRAAPADMVRFELRNVAGELEKILYGNKRKAMPFLTSEILNTNTERYFLDPDNLANTINTYKKRDYSIFYREVMFKSALGSTFVQQEVMPNFVLYPVFGTRSIMWQEMEGNKKSTPGRFFFPLFYSGKLDEEIIKQMAFYRWELQKNLAGYNWTDPVEGGVVGSYYDYVNFYKKNPELTPEAKERLVEFLKKVPQDRDRFAHDYAIWVTYEYDGKMRLNNYVRDLFYRYCPFPAAVRKQMAEKPVFEKLEIKFKNRSKKEILKVQSKMLRFEKKGHEVPKEFQDHLDFINF